MYNLENQNTFRVSYLIITSSFLNRRVAGCRGWLSFQRSYYLHFFLNVNLPDRPFSPHPRSLFATRHRGPSVASSTTPFSFDVARSGYRYSRLYLLDPEMSFHVPRIEGVLRQLRRSVPFTKEYFYRIKKTTSPDCAMCSTPESVTHLICDLPFMLLNETNCSSALPDWIILPVWRVCSVHGLTQSEPLKPTRLC